MYFLVLTISQIFIIHGKSISSFAFSEKNTFINSNYHNIETYISICVISLLFLLIKNLKLNIYYQSLLFSTVGLIGASIIQYFALSESTLIFLLHLYIFAVSGVIIILEPLFSKDLNLDFWKMIFEYMVKLIKYFMIIFGALVAVLKFLSQKNNETTDGFLTTLFYPSIILIISFFMIAYWIMIPSWNKIVDGSKEEDK